MMATDAVRIAFKMTCNREAKAASSVSLSEDSAPSASKTSLAHSFPLISGDWMIQDDAVRLVSEKT